MGLTIGREGSCGGNTLVEKGLPLLPRHGCICIGEDEANGFVKASELENSLNADI